jgi:RimJ/RimL family protein N-acetyltransferase
MNPAQLDRFTVRDVNMWDAADVFALFGNPAVVKYMGLRRLQTVEEASALIERYQSSPSRWLAVLEGPKFLGIVGLEVRSYQATMTIASNGIRRGFGREFGVPFSQWVMSHPQIWRLWSYVHVDNLLGQRVTERSGATKEGRLRRFEMFPNISTEPQDCYIYSIVKG